MKPVCSIRCGLLTISLLVLAASALLLFAAEPEATEADLYQLPASNKVEDLFAFIDKIQNSKPDTAAEFAIYRPKAWQAIELAVEKILKLEKDPKSENAQEAVAILRETRIEYVDLATPEKQRELLEEFTNYLAEQKLTKQDLQNAGDLAANLELSDNTKLAVEAYSAFAKRFDGSDNEKFRRAVKRFKGAVGRLTMAGKPFEVKGATYDGKSFDWGKYRGKVVLVDFWATWCKPCLKELPNVKRNYEKYHARGFDVVGISMDTDLPNLGRFLQKEKLPWVTLNEQRGADGVSPMWDKYGLVSVPSTFLVDKEGKVISMNARGEGLGEQLEKLLGAATPISDKPTSHKPEKDATKKSK